MDLKKKRGSVWIYIFDGGNPSLKVNIFTQKDNALGNV